MPSLRRSLLIPLISLVVAALACTPPGGAEPTATRVPPRNTQPPRATATDEVIEPTDAPEPTDEPTEAPTAEPASDVFEDDFSDPDPGWLEEETDEYSVGFEDEAYRVAIAAESTHLILTPGLDLGDVAVEVDATWAAGEVESAQIGVACRVVDEDNLYRLYFGPNDSYGIGRVVDGSWELLTRRERQPSALDLDPGGTNRIRADCVGTTLTLWINDEPVLQVEDDVFDSGDAGIWTYTPNGGLEVVYDDFAAGPSEFAEPIGEFETADLGTVVVETGFDDEEVFSPSAEIDGGVMAVEDGGYHITVENEYWDLWHTVADTYGDAQIEVEATWLSDVDESWEAWAGVMCRVTDFDNHYAFLLAPDGYAVLRLRLDGESFYLADGMTDYAVDTGEPIYVRGDCLGDTLTLYVNDELVFQVTDDSFDEGEAGLVVGSGEAVPVEATLDNFALYEP
jgi:hypothetical protein